MADNTTLNPGTGGDTIATDDIAGVKHQLVKVEYGAADSATQVSTSNPLPVDTELTTVDADTGAGTDTRAGIVLVRAESGGGVLVGSGNPLPVSGTVTANTGTDNTLIDNAGFTDGSSRVFPVGLIFDDVAGTALTENDVAAARINANRATVSTIEDGATRARYATVTAANALKVDASGVAVPVTDNASSLTVDAPVGTPVFVRLSDGSAALVGQKTMANSLPVVIASDQSAVSVTAALSTGTNTIGDVGIKPRTSGGLTKFHLVSAASTNATNIKASAGQVFGYYISNRHATNWGKLVFHDTAGTPTAGASVYATVDIPPASAANVFSDIGIVFATGIAITTVTGAADTDATAVGANDLNINIYYS